MAKPRQNGEGSGRPDFRPHFARKGDLWTPRWVITLLREDVITAREMAALTAVIDETRGWKRLWVALSRRDWGRLVGCSPRQACRARDALLEEGLLRKRDDQTPALYAYCSPEDRDRLEEIRAAARGNGHLFEQT